MSNEQDQKDIWASLIAVFKKEVDERAYLYGDDLRFDGRDNSAVRVYASSGFIADTVKNRFFTRLQELTADFFGPGVSLRIGVDAERPEVSPVPAQASRPASPAGGGAHCGGGATVPAPPVITAGIEKPLESKKPLPQDMNENFTFDTFVPDKSTQYAYAMAQAVAQNPGLPNTNPLFIYGPVGTGKTHLMQAIGLYAHFNTDKKVIYTTTDIFVEDFITATKQNAMTPFKNKYRKTDFLLIDDIHNLKKNMAASQEEIFYTLEAFFKAKRQIVFTSDRPAKELKEVQDRITSRLGQGSQFSLSMPPFETRCAIVRKKLEGSRTGIPNEVIEFMCKNINSNLRDLVGALNDLVNYATLVRQPLTLEIAQKQIRARLVSTVQGPIPAEKIQKIVAEYYSLKLRDLIKKDRSSRVAMPRQIAMYLMRELTELSSSEIAKEFEREHATVLHATKKIEAGIINDPALETTIQELIRIIKEGGTE